MLCALLIGRGYTRYINKRISEGDGFIAFLNHAKEEIAMFLSPPARLCRGFFDESLDEIGFIDAIRSCGNLGDAFLQCAPRLSVGKEARDLLSECFRSFGQGYKEQEVARIERYSRGLEEILERERRDLPQNARMVSTLLLAGAAGIFIMLL